ncbi:MAG: Dihydroorotate dehydrogenase [Thermotogales bacterium 46_20]|nr:MAG: Dihydroorotate dehydrogenase [Thermotogales bacterium 46_20]
MTMAFGMEFSSPVVVSSGPAGFGSELAEMIDMSCVGAFTFKSVTREERKGNQPPRIVDCGYGMLASIGLQNPGIENFISDILPQSREWNTRIIVSIAAFNLEDFGYMSSILNTVEDFDVLELNLSCPNVEAGKEDPVTDPEYAGTVVARVKDGFKTRPVTVKLSPESSPTELFLKKCEDSGADGFTLFNAFHGARFDVDTGKPFLKRVDGAYTSPALKPLILRKIHLARQITSKPIIASGGTSTAEDILEYMSSGADLVSFGLISAIEPELLMDIPGHLGQLLKARGYESLSDYRSFLAETTKSNL